MQFLSMIILFVLTIAFPAAAAWNEPNVAEAKEYRLMKYYPHARVMEYEVKEFDSAKMVTAYTKGADEPAVFEDIEGRLVYYHYEHKPSTSTLQIVRQYDNLLKAQGFEVIISGKGAIMKGLGINDDDGDGYYRWDEPGRGVLWIHVHAFYNGGRDAPESQVTIVEAKAMEQTLLANAATMMSVLESTGRVAVYGVNFGAATATITPDSEAVLDEVQKLLDDSPALRIGIEGHTDNVGEPAANRKLSADRAASVKAWMVAHGIDAARLETLGFGDTKPVADNDSDDGRAKNRRVELIRK